MERELTLSERIRNLELHHEETRKRMHDMEETIRHERERLDTVLGSEPKPAAIDVDVARDYASSR